MGRGGGAAAADDPRRVRLTPPWPGRPGRGLARDPEPGPASAVSMAVSSPSRVDVVDGRPVMLVSQPWPPGRPGSTAGPTRFHCRADPVRLPGRPGSTTGPTRFHCRPQPCAGPVSLAAGPTGAHRDRPSTRAARAPDGPGCPRRGDTRRGRGCLDCVGGGAEAALGGEGGVDAEHEVGQPVELPRPHLPSAHDKARQGRRRDRRRRARRRRASSWVRPRKGVCVQV